MKNLRKSAQSLIEYGLILALVAIVALTVLSKLGATISGVGNDTSNTVSNVSTGAGQNYCNSIHGTWNAGNSTCN